jgi:hypothetical protein
MLLMKVLTMNLAFRCFWKTRLRTTSGSGRERWRDVEKKEGEMSGRYERPRALQKPADCHRCGKQ